jgi:MFS family permease
LLADSGTVRQSNPYADSSLKSPGIGIGIVTTVVPLYLSELVPARDRGRAVGFMAAGAGIASVLATVIVWGTEKLNDSRQYKIPLEVQTAAPLALLALSLLLTESPFWLLSKGHLAKARRILTSIRVDNPMLVEAELSAAIASLQSSEDTTSSTNFWEILKPPHLKRTLTAGALISLSQVGGQIICGTY